MEKHDFYEFGQKIIRILTTKTVKATNFEAIRITETAVSFRH